MLTIDGSKGEGGGQILRSALALALVTGEPFRITNIRAGREKPGLMRQHLTAVTAAAALSRGTGRVEGAALGAQTLSFWPGTPVGGTYEFSIGTAGSATLVFQTILPALLFAKTPSYVELEGGTHNPLAPTFDFLQRVYVPLLRRMGARVELELERRGFYPAGGGRFRAAIEPTARLERVRLLERGAIRARRGRAIVASLPVDIAHRETAAFGRETGWGPKDLEVERDTTSLGPGNVFLAEVESEHVTELFSGIGKKAVSAERVAHEVATETRRYLAAGVPVGEHLADQLILPMALAGGGAFRTLEPTPHMRSQVEVIEAFLGHKTRLEPVAEDVWHVEVEAQAG